jgi:hypothetical protein
MHGATIKIETQVFTMVKILIADFEFLASRCLVSGYSCFEGRCCLNL